MLYISCFSYTLLHFIPFITYSLHITWFFFHSPFSHCFPFSLLSYLLLLLFFHAKLLSACFLFPSLSSPTYDFSAWPFVNIAYTTFFFFYYIEHKCNFKKADFLIRIKKIISKCIENWWNYFQNLLQKLYICTFIVKFFSVFELLVLYKFFFWAAKK